uniref:Sulfatase N-terminal domain-containing protein n=1 Tax=Ciona savignyi TaxID=51511 RepID=H2ZAS2_CIOSA
MMLWVDAVFALQCLLLFVAGSYGQGGSKPHVVMVLVDDMGWNDVQWNNPNVYMPNLQALAEEGVILNHAYAQEKCTPSRAALLTGRYPINTGMQEEVVVATQMAGLPMDFKLLPQYMKDYGYATHMIGKWHVGYCDEAYTPTKRGFDSHYGFYNSGISYSGHSSSEGTEVGLDYRDDLELITDNTVYTTTDFTDEAIRIIDNHDKATPMFLYMAYNAPHTPFEVDSSYTAYYDALLRTGNRKTYLGMISALDYEVNRLVNKLKDSEMWSNTVFVFYSDNGGTQVQSGQSGNNYPLRGKKGSLFEGGYRVPAFVNSPLLSNTGYIHDGLFHITDMFTTLIYLAGGDAAVPSDIDGINAWNAISDNTASPRTDLVYNIITKQYANNKRSTEPHGAIRDLQYKLIEGNPGGGELGLEGWVTPAEDSTDILSPIANVDAYVDPTTNTSYYLFDLINDPYETNNIAATEPTILADMIAKLLIEKRSSRRRHAIDNTKDLNAIPSLNGGSWNPGFCVAT